MIHSILGLKVGHQFVLESSVISLIVALFPNPDLSPPRRTYRNIIKYVNTAEYCFYNNLIWFAHSLGNVSENLTYFSLGLD